MITFPVLTLLACFLCRIWPLTGLSLEALFFLLALCHYPQTTFKLRTAIHEKTNKRELPCWKTDLKYMPPTGFYPKNIKQINNKERSHRKVDKTLEQAGYKHEKLLNLI